MYRITALEITEHLTKRLNIPQGFSPNKRRSTITSLCDYRRDGVDGTCGLGAQGCAVSGKRSTGEISLPPVDHHRWPPIPITQIVVLLTDHQHPPINATSLNMRRIHSVCACEHGCSTRGLLRLLLGYGNDCKFLWFHLPNKNFSNYCYFIPQFADLALLVLPEV